MPDSYLPTATVRVTDVYPYRTEADGTPRFLVVRRADGHTYHGQWRMIGGKIDPGETAWQSALRELAEETGLTPTRLWALPSVNHFYEWQRDTVALIPAFAAEVTGEPVLCEEHDAFDWLPVEDAAERLFWPEQRRLLRLAGELVATGQIAPELEIPLGAEAPASR